MDKKERGRLFCILMDGSYSIPFIIKKDILLLGRSDLCEIRINVNGVSPEHCEITFNAEGRGFVAPVNKSELTFLNGEIIERQTSLEHNDVITVVKWSFRFFYPNSSKFFVAPPPFSAESCMEPLNSTDDVSKEDPSDLFDTENVVACQYDKELKKEKVGSKMKVRKVSKTIKTASKKQHILKTGKSHIKRKLVKRDQSVNKVSVSNQEDMSYSDISEKPNSHLNMTYGFIGISTLKLRRAVLLKLINSFEIVFWDPVMVNKMKRGKNIKKIKQANSPAQLIKSCDVTFCCYGSDADDFLEILNGENGILAGFRVAERLRRKRGFVHLAFSLDSKYSEIIDKGAKKKDCVYLEALISQSYGKTFIDASGDINLFKNCEKCFELIASECSFLGKILGAASAKNNISLAFSGMLSNILAEGALLFHKLIPNTPKSNVTAILTALIENRFLNTVLDSKEESEEDNMRIKHLQENLEAVVNETAKLDLNMSIAAASNDYLHGIQLNYSDE